MSPGIDRTRTLQGAVCGTVAAAVWAVQQPLDKAVFRSRYDDVELLGRALTRQDGWYPVGLASHLANGALFGAVYANVSPSLPIPPSLRAPALALTEHVALWPLVAVSDRFHPARRQLPALGGSRRAWWQAAYRHLLFGVVLGELYRRLRSDSDAAEPVAEADYSSNGHGRIEHAVSVPATGPGADPSGAPGA